MLIKLIVWGPVLACYLSGSLLYAENYKDPIIQTPENMNVEKIGVFFADYPDADEITWAPLVRDTTRLALNIPRDGFERALDFKDGNALFHLSSVSDLGLQIQGSDMISVGFNLASDGYLIEVRNDFSEAIAVGLSVEYLDKLKFGGFLKKSLVYNSTMLSATVGYGTGASGYIGGEAVQLSFDEESELFSWMNISTENDDGNLGFGKTWFDVQYNFDSTVMAHWNNKGWRAGLLLNKATGETNFSLGLVDLDQTFTPTLYAGFSIPLENFGKFSSKILLKSRGLKSQYLPKQSLKFFRRNELSSQWRDAMDFSLQN